MRRRGHCPGSCILLAAAMETQFWAPGISCRRQQRCQAGLNIGPGQPGRCGGRAEQ